MLSSTLEDTLRLFGKERFRPMQTVSYTHLTLPTT